ncbi:MAG: L-threonine 3-dehydrogenase [Firmicutes bacterium]|nr:L-threonine 3-dehydrogenase [Bacillota bacterium]
MKALRKTTAGPGLELVEVPIPEIRDDQVLVKIEVASICGTDLHIYNWDQWSQNRIKPPVTIGHEFAGRIVQLGSNVKGLELGQLVTAEGHFVCNTCYYCRTGQGHICDDVKILGVDTDGIFAEYAAIDASNVWVLPEGSDPAIGAIHDPLGNAFHAASPHKLTGQNVLITGCGPIGLFTVAVAKQAGAKQIFATDINPYRLNLAKEAGADWVINPLEDNVEEFVKDHTGLGADALIEMSGSTAALASGIAALRKGATASLLGIFSRPVELNLDEIIFNQITITGINGRRMYDTWYDMEAALAAGLDVSSIITHRFTFDEVDKAMELMNSGATGKVLLYPDGDKLKDA